MSKKFFIWLGVSSIIIGAVIFVCAMSFLKWDFSKLSTNKYQTNEYQITEEFSSVLINTSTANIEFVASSEDKVKVVCYEEEGVKHEVIADNETLKVSVNDTRKWYQHVSINFQTPKITVYMPVREYSSLTIKESTGNINLPSELKFNNIDLKVSTGAVKCLSSANELIKISSSTGDIKVENVDCGAIDLSVTTGKIEVLDVNCDADVKMVVSTGKVILTNVSCKNLVSSGKTGDISLQKVVASEKFDIERSTGDVKFEGCDAGEIFIQTDTGDVDGSLLTEKVFIVKTDTGDVDVPNSITGGRCEITTDTGDVKIMIKN